MHILRRALWCPMAIGLIVFSADVEAGCNDAVLAQQIQQKWQAPLERAKGSICSTAKVMVGMLGELRTTLQGCLAEAATERDSKEMRALKNGRSAALDNEIVTKIAEWQSTQNSVCR